MAKKKVPLWIKLIPLLAMTVLIASIVLFPAAVRAAVSYERGWEAQRNGRHSTAIKEYEEVLKQFPGSPSVMARLAISYFHNERIDECSELLDRIAGKEVSGKLSRQVNDIVEKMDSIYYESKELGEVLALYGQEELEKTAERLSRYLNANKKDVMGIFHMANINFDMGRYNEAEKLYIRAIELQPQFYSAYLNLAAAYRETGQLEKAVECCNKVLESNKEHPQVFIALSKIELKGNNTKAALGYAKKAYEYDSGDLHIIANLCLAYHYNKMNADRDKYLEMLKQNNYYDLAALQSVFEAEAK
ncbi:MAG TPA: tetratricopeptide repeat protein [Candidatus Nitrosocosmicus sp.]|nr:tetratricopeptide repeat protein [Candidatus Nitrosocosmicus sp.]